MSRVEVSKVNEGGEGKPMGDRKVEPAAAPIMRSLYDGIVTLTFDMPGSSANVINHEVLDCLSSHLDWLEGADINGVVLKSSKPSIFIAGADLKPLSGKISDYRLRELIRSGQDVFNRFARLPMPTVACIHGACVGGGFELALCCDYRVASNHRSTSMGLPETQLGILPAWGGSTRLPRLIGLPHALPLILEGRLLPAAKAKKLGMVDEVVLPDYFDEAAQKCFRKGKRKLPGRFFANNMVILTIIRMVARSKLWKKTRGNYPAIEEALHVVTTASHSSESYGLQLEREAILELAFTPAARNLMRLFFMREGAKKLLRDGGSTVPVPKRAAVIGAGVMGAGIAQWISSKGYPVMLKDISPDQVANGLITVRKLSNALVKRRKVTKAEGRAIVDRVSPVHENVPMHNVDLVIEAAVEQMDVKKRIFKQLENLTRHDTVLATNTSALSINELASAMDYPERVVGIHFFNPVYRMPLVEVVRGEQSNTQTIVSAVRFVQKLGKLPVVVKDSPGFVVNRILVPYLVEAGELYDQGASVKAVDEAMLNFGMPMGPLRLIDEVGTDIALHVAQTLSRAFPEHIEVPAILERMVDADYLGKKNGKGFFLYKNGKVKGENSGMKRLAGFSRAATESSLIEKRMTLLMINEAARCVEERIVEHPADVDFAMVMGTGFAPFRGGVLRYASTLGESKVCDELLDLSERVNPKFAPCRFIQEMASGKKEFMEAAVS